MPEELTTQNSTRSDSKSSTRSNVIPITSITDLGTIVGDIQNQLTLLVNRLNSEVSPEFKALMEGFINKANETESTKVRLEDLTTSYDEVKAEVAKVRETNRTLVNELQHAREILKKLESELNTFQSTAKKTEEGYKDKIKNLTKQIQEFESTIGKSEEEKTSMIAEQEKLRQETLDQKYNFHQKEQQLTIEKDNLRKQLDEAERLLKEQSETLDLKSKELDYKDVLLNQLIRQTTSDKLKPLSHEEPENNLIKSEKKKKFWFFN
jgi:chromosome segregation ATPase